MNAALNDGGRGPADLLADLIERHGTWRVVGALAATLMRRAPRYPPGPDLPDHLRRDIGLPDLPGHGPTPQRVRRDIENPLFRL